MKANISFDQRQIAEFCRRRQIEKLAFFGSVLREDFQPESDVDVLVSFLPGVSYGLLEMVHLRDELANILGRNVDLVERQAIEQSENYIRRRHIFASEEPVYVAG